MKLNILIFLLFSFILAAVSDLVVNVLSERINTPALQSIRPYFQKFGYCRAMLNAGLITIIIMSFGLLIYYILTQSLTTNFFQFNGMIFLVGMLADLLVNKLNLAGNSLRPYYNHFGTLSAALWGGLSMSFVFSLYYLFSMIKN